MNILFITMRFYDYEFYIKKEFEKFNNHIDMFYDTPLTYYKSRRLLSKNEIQQENQKYQNEIIRESQKRIYDVIFVIVGRALSFHTLQEIKRNNPNAKFILYLWDDIKRVINFEETKSFYNKIYSFDYVDCEKNNFDFLPLFFLDSYSNNNDINTTSFDLYSALWMHSDRLSIVKKIIRQISKRKMLFYFKVEKIPFFIYTIKSFFSPKERKYIKYGIKGISKEQNIENMKKSKVILDIQFPSQNGLTIRTFEALGAKKKFITTNKSIKNYDFYNKNNIYVIEDRNNPVIPDTFFDSPYKDLTKQIYNKYSLNSWVKHILADL